MSMAKILSIITTSMTRSYENFPSVKLLHAGAYAFWLDVSSHEIIFGQLEYLNSRVELNFSWKAWIKSFLKKLVTNLTNTAVPQVHAS